MREEIEENPHQPIATTTNSEFMGTKVLSGSSRSSKAMSREKCFHKIVT